jgi:protein ImuB
VAANQLAIRHGIQPERELVAGLALCPNAIIKVRDRNLETQALQSIATWAEQFTPTRSLAEPMAVLLEIGGCIRYFGGLDVLLSNLKTEINDLGYCPVIATAPTATGALLLAHSRSNITITELAVLREALKRLPLRALSYPERSIDALESTGARTIGDCLGLPRDGVARRYGQALLDIIGRAMGDIPDPHKPFLSPETYTGKLELPAPVWDAEALLFGVKRLSQEMCGWLAGRYHGVTRLQLDLIHEEAPLTSLMLDLSKPTRSADDLLMLWRERVSRQKLPDRVEAITLHAVETMNLDSRPLSLLPGRDDEDDNVNLLDRLRARLGDKTVLTLQSYSDHRPELAWKGRGTRDLSSRIDRRIPDSPRPVWFLAKPQRLEKIGEDKKGAWILIDGPERIEAGWWDGGEAYRDYYVARNPEGQTLWIYRDWHWDGEWFLQGLFA